MKTQIAPPGALVVDSLPYSEGGTPAQAHALAAAGVRCLIGYLGAITAARVGFLHDAGVAFMPVTFANAYDAGRALAQLHALDYPAGAHVWLDVENANAARLGRGAALTTPLAALEGQIDGWGDAISAAGYVPAGYFGVPQPFTSDELWERAVKLYWRGQGSLRDRNDALAEPSHCGFVATQSYPSFTLGGVLVDASIFGRDYLGRGVTWAIGD